MAGQSLVLATGSCAIVASTLLGEGFSPQMSGLLVHAGLVLILLLFVAWALYRSKRAAALLKPVARAVRSPLIALLMVVGARILLPYAPFDAGGRGTIRQVLIVATVIVITWLAFRLLAGAKSGLLARFDVTEEDNLRARQIHTQAHVLVRTMQILLLILGLGGALMAFPQIRQIGISLLASAGILALAIGIAARPTLENLIAGLQIALTQPIRLDDALLIEDEMGWVEEINSTYVVIRVWDDRRLIIPLRRFIDSPFQNWTRKTARLLGTVFLHCDYTTDVDAVRSELRSLCEVNPNWDKRLAIVQVTEATEQSMQLRALVSAGSAPRLWDLRVAVREGLIKHLQQRGSALPRVRASIRSDRVPGDEDPRPGPLPHSA